MTKKPEIKKTESNLFRDAMRGVKPIKHTKITVENKISPVVRKKNKMKEWDNDEDIFSDFEKLPAVSSEETLQFSRPGIQHKILRNLRNGKYNVEAILDLHGQTSLEARKSLSRFLLSCQQKGIRHALIIHGKGRNNNKPILKNKLNHWLRQTEQVLAFCSATGRDGRSGALYVLLKIPSFSSQENE